MDIPLINEKCWLCNESISGIRTCTCGAVFHKECIVNWLSYVDTCPFCHKPFEVKFCDKIFIFFYKLQKCILKR